jgi:Cu(I)/Ag(I) efflux system membrane protein CusA/SilA
MPRPVAASTVPRSGTGRECIRPANPIAVWVGLIALAGLDAETGVVMLLYLDLAYERWRREGRMASFADLAGAVHHGAVKRIRPKMMTVTTTFRALEQAE